MKKPVRLFTKSPTELSTFAEKFGAKGSEYGVYFGVCKRAREGGKKADIAGATCLWADIDCVVNGQKIDVLLKLIGEMPANIQPSIVVHSGGGLHLYWLIDPVDIASRDVDYVGELEFANKFVGNLVGGDSVHDITRVMRLPGTYNNKRKPEKKCEVIYCAHHLKYNLAKLVSDIERWGKVIDGDKWVDAKKVHGLSKTRTTNDRDDVASLHRFEKSFRTGKATGVLDKFWRDRVRQHAPRGYVGIHEAIVITTARLYCAGDFTLDRIVDKCVEYIQAVPDLDTSDWDWNAERVKIRNAAETWGPKWKQIRKEERKRV